MNKLTLLLSIACLSSCYTSKKAVEQSVKAYVNYPDKVAELHSKWFPISSKTVIEKEYIQGKDSIIIDTVTVDCSEVVNEVEKIVKVPVAVNKYRVDTFRISTIDSLENTAKIESLKYDNDVLSNDILRLEKTLSENAQKIRQKNNIIIALSSILLIIFFVSFVYLYLKIKSKTIL